MRSLCLLSLILVFCSGISGQSEGAEYRLTNGDVIRGQAISFNDDGFVVRLDIGGFSPRISWSRVSQETLKELAKNPEAAPYAEPFIEIPPEVREKEREKKKEIKIGPVPRIETPESRSFFGSLATPGGLAVLLVLYLGNLYAAYIIAHFRRRPVALVGGLSAILPVIGPIIFLAMPAAPEGETAAAPVEPIDPSAPGYLAGAKKTTAAHPAQASGLSLASQGAKPGGAASLDGSVFKRGETTFNRRFFESTFPGFFRVVPSEAEKDLVLVVRGGRNEYVAKRISRISSSEMHLQLLQGNEVSVPFTEVSEVRVRHKDAKG